MDRFALILEIQPLSVVSLGRRNFHVAAMGIWVQSQKVFEQSRRVHCGAMLLEIMFEITCATLGLNA
jgi:hypothetical protein